MANGLVPVAQTSVQVTGTLTAAASVARWVAPCDGVITGVTAAVTTAPTGAAIIVDLHNDGVTVFTTQANRPTIAISATTTAVKTADVIVFTAGDVFTIDVDQIGSDVAGAGLNLCIAYTGK